MAPGEVVLDIETSNTFQDTGRRDPATLRVSVVGVYTSVDDRFFTLEESELGQLWPIVEHAERTIGYNIRGFDFPVLNNYYPGDLLRLPILDLMDEPAAFLGFRPSLNDLARATLHVEKSGHGLDAVVWWREGRKDDVKRYCLDDVRITRDLYRFGLAHQQLQFRDRLGKELTIPVHFTAVAGGRAAVNLSLPL